MKTCLAKRFLVVGIATAGVIVGPYASREAAAAWRSMHASACRIVSGSVTYTTAGQIANLSTTDSVVLACPFDGDSRVPSSGAVHATVTLSGWSAGSGGIVAKVCTTWATGGGGTCAAAPYTSVGQGVRQMALSTNFLENQALADLAYVSVTLGPMSGGSANVIWGYVMGGGF